MRVRLLVACCCAVFMMVFLAACSAERAASSMVGFEEKKDIIKDARFEREYDLKENGLITLRNASGDISIKGYEGDKVRVVATKQGRDADKAVIEDRSGDSKVDVRARLDDCRNCQLEVVFEVQVPRNRKFEFREIRSASGNVIVEFVNGDVVAQTASGDVRISDVTGRVEAETASGDVEIINVAGTASGETASGNVTARLARIEGDGNMDFSTASGNVEVALPADANANVELSTVSGNVTTDFPIQVTRPQYGPGAEAEGKIGNGGRKIEASAVSGNVTLSKQ